MNGWISHEVEWVTHLIEDRYTKKAEVCEKNALNFILIQIARRISKTDNKSNWIKQWWSINST